MKEVSVEELQNQMQLDPEIEEMQNSEYVKELAAKARLKREADKEMEELELTPEQFQHYLSIRELVRPELYDINLMLDDYIVGEEFNRLSVFCVHILGYGCVYLSGDSGSGKTQIMDTVAKTVLPSDYLILDQCSDKVIYDKKIAIEKAKYVALPELNKINGNPLIVEVMKSWGEGKMVVYERAQIGGRGPQRIELPCRPFIFSRATESAGTNAVPGELYTRVAEFTADASKNQTRAVNSRVAEDVESPFDVKRTDKVQSAAYRYFVSNLPTFDYYINPAAGVLVDYVPTMFAASRRDYKKYLKNTEGIARFYHTDRIKFEKEGKSCIMITPADVFYNHVIFGNTLIRSAMRCNEIEKIIIKFIQGVVGKAATAQSIHSGLRQNNINTTVNNVKTYVESLVNIGYLMVEKQGRENYYLPTDFYKEFEVKPNMENIVDYMVNSVTTNPHYSDFADEYVERFCNKKDIKAVDPFTGNTVNIMTYEFEEINNVKVDVDNTRMKPRKQQQGLDGWT